MGFDQKGTLVFRVARGNDNKWDVNEAGFDKPLASFDNEKDARTYADDLAGGNDTLLALMAIRTFAPLRH